MVLPDRPENNFGSEPRDVQKKALIVFHGMVVSPFNLQGIKPTIAVFEQALARPSGRKVLYMEDPAATYEDSQRSKMVVEHHGLVDPILGNIFRARGLSPRGQDDLDNLRQMIDRADVSAIEAGLLPFTMAREYFFHQELERLRIRHPFDIEYERHSPGVVERVSAGANEIERANMASLHHWHNGQIGLLVADQRRLHQASRQSAVLREPENAEYLTRLTETILQSADKGVLLIPFSAVNSPLVHSLRRNFWENSPIELQITRGGLGQSPEIIIQERLQERAAVSDDLYAQHFLGNVMSAAVMAFAAGKRRLISYMQNYETLEEAIFEIATHFSLPKIEGLARSRRDLLDVLRADPGSTPLLPYISRLLF